MKRTRENCPTALQEAGGLWSSWGFEQWSWRGLGGVRRRVTLSKDSLLGPIGACHVDDHIVWTQDRDVCPAMLMRDWRPAPGVMTHRLLFVGEGPARPFRRAFLLGLRGYLEAHWHEPGSPPAGRARDLAELVERALDSNREG